RLSQAVVWLRPRLEGPDLPRSSVLLADRLQIGLQPGSFTTDVAEFQEALQAAAATSEATERPRWLQRAVELYGGELLPGHDEEWILTERQHLLSLFVAALRRLAAHHEQRHEWDAALACARRAVTADPLEEEAHRDLLRVLAAAGHPASALRHLRELERLFARELDAKPS